MNSIALELESRTLVHNGNTNEDWKKNDHLDGFNYKYFYN
jgi:hypothetical protein